MNLEERDTKIYKLVAAKSTRSVGRIVTTITGISLIVVGVSGAGWELLVTFILGGFFTAWLLSDEEKVILLEKELKDEGQLDLRRKDEKAKV